MVDDDRGETSSLFASSARITRYFNRFNRMIIRRPGVRTIGDSQTIAFTGNGSFTLNADVKEIISLISGGAGVSNSIIFKYLPPDEFEELVSGYAWTIKQKGKIEIFATSTTSLPTTNLTLQYWSKNIILDTDGTTKKAVWANNGDTSRLPAEFDDAWVSYADFMIKKREGKRQEAADALSLVNEQLDSLTVETGMPRPTKQARAWGHFATR